LKVSTLWALRQMLKAGGGGINCIISMPANVAAPIATGGMSICFLLIVFLGFSSFTFRFGIYLRSLICTIRIYNVRECTRLNSNFISIMI
jgi:hypothetical protein